GQIAQLNEDIVRAEVGGSLQGQANDLRDRRDYLIRELAKITNIETVEQPTGSVDVRVGGNFLVSGNDAFEIELRVHADRGVDIDVPEFAINGNLFAPSEGELGGILAARDDIIPSFMQDLDEMARTFMQTFNEVHSTGRGLNGLTSVTSTAFTPTHVLQNNLPISIQGTVQRGNNVGSFLVDPSLRGFPSGQANAEYFVGAKVLFTSGENEGRSAVISRYDPGSGRLDFNPPLNSPVGPGDSFEITSLDYPIENGSFKLNVRNEVTGITDVFDIEVDRDGLPTAPNLDDTSVQDLINDINTQLNNFYGGNAPVVARINDDYQVQIQAIDNDVSFHFSDDTSGFLAAAGLNTFFGGSNA
ncbi:MAG: hypothetical protein KDB07_13815, partial [Planctomycetes bacterium]|nr:hypothetical protein [Planctomycetota bacterium]